MKIFICLVFILSSVPSWACTTSENSPEHIQDLIAWYSHIDVSETVRPAEAFTLANIYIHINAMEHAQVVNQQKVENNWVFDVKYKSKLLDDPEQIVVNIQDKQISHSSWPEMSFTQALNTRLQQLKSSLVLKELAAKGS